VPGCLHKGAIGVSGYEGSGATQLWSQSRNCRSSKFEARIKELVDNPPDLAALVQPLLAVRRVLREQIGILHRRLLAVVRNDEVCRRLITIPGVGPVVALTYRATVDVPARFRKSKSVGAVFGLTCAKYRARSIVVAGYRDAASR
jgi:transposase